MKKKRKTYSERTCLMACRRVLRMVDDYLAKQPQDTLTTDGKGLMTLGEIRQHVQGALRLARRAK